MKQEWTILKDSLPTALSKVIHIVSNSFVNNTIGSPTGMLVLRLLCPSLVEHIDLSFS